MQNSDFEFIYVFDPYNIMDIMIHTDNYELFLSCILTFSELRYNSELLIPIFNENDKDNGEKMTR